MTHSLREQPSSILNLRQFICPKNEALEDVLHLPQHVNKLMRVTMFNNGQLYDWPFHGSYVHFFGHFSFRRQHVQRDKLIVKRNLLLLSTRLCWHSDNAGTCQVPLAPRTRAMHP